MKINEAMPDWMTAGIFTAISSGTYQVPWLASVDAASLDLDYHGNRSGGKEIAPIIDLMVGTRTSLTAVQISNLAKIITGKYGKSWTKEWSVYDLTYNPLNNATMEEHTSVSGTNTGTVQNSDNYTHGEKIDRTSEATAEQTNGVYGFDSTSVSDADKQNGTNNITEAETHSGSDVNSGTRTDNLLHSETTEYTRAGSIGIITPQTMIQQERDVWMWKFFDDVVYPDVDRVLSITVY